MRNRFPESLLVGVLATVAACDTPGRPAVTQASWTDPFPHQSDYITANGVRLNYLDWGGRGPMLVMVHGLTDSPHIFDDFASLLRDRFHVIAYARRGHGHSDAPNGPYDQATLVEDLRQLLDILGIARAGLLGWSMGGNEITAFASLHPERVTKLVYLEAGYDWSNPRFQGEFPQLSADATSLSSLDAYRTWYRRMWFGNTPWTPGLEAYLRDITRIDPDGHVRPVPSGAVLDALSNSNANSSRDYRHVRAPALALYASAFLPMDPAMPAAMRVSQLWENQVMAEFRRASIERVRQELPSVVVTQLPNTAHMSILVLELRAIASAVRDFLESPNPEN